MKLRQSFIFILLALSLGLFGTRAFAQQMPSFRFGVVIIDRIMKESAPAKAAQTRLEQEFSRREKDLQSQGADIKAKADQLERDGATMSDSQRATKQRDLSDLDRDFQRRRREFQEDLQRRRNEELQQVIERANRVIKQVAESEKYDLILQEAVYVNPKLDITDKVIAALNASK
jgi:outer membrane protein